MEDFLPPLVKILFLRVRPIIYASEAISYKYVCVLSQPYNTIRILVLVSITKIDF